MEPHTQHDHAGRPQHTKGNAMTLFPMPGHYDIFFAGSTFFSPMLVHQVADGFVLVGWGEDDQPLTGNPVIDQLEGNAHIWVSMSQIIGVLPASSRA